MPGFASYQQLAVSTQVGRSATSALYKAAQAPQGAGAWYSSWTQAGVPAAGANPASTPGTAYVSAAGAFTFPDVAPQRRYLSQVMLTPSSQPMTLMVYDRLVGVGSLSITSAGSRTVNSVPLPRYAGADSVGVQAWIEVPSALTVSTALQLSLSSYTNQDGVAGRAGTAVNPPFATLPAGSLIGPLPLQAGDTGVRSVEVGLGVGGTVPATGVVNLLLLRPLTYLFAFAGNANERDQIVVTTKLPRVHDGASLAFAFLAGSTTAFSYWGTLATVWG